MSVHHPQPLPLKEYLVQRQIKIADFAKEIGVTYEAARRYVTGERRPAWDVIPRIHEATGGAVTAQSFVNSPKH